MPSINGVDFNNIGSVSGVSWNSVTNIGGVPVSHGASCTPVNYGFIANDGTPPTAACGERPQEYAYDATNNLLYIAGKCGVTFAQEGFYSDGRDVYYWDGAEIFEYVTACGK
jgi:hypothetical protein